MLDELAMAYQVVRRPNSAFAALRDDDHRYFLPSIVVMLLATIVYIGFDLATPEARQQIDYVLLGLAPLGSVIGAGTIYVIGRGLGGNKSWRKTLTVIFYAEAISILVVAASLPFYLLSSLLPTSLLGVVGAVALAAAAWGVIVLVKAVKVLNGFGTAKAFGILILSVIVHLIWVIPIVLFYSPAIPGGWFEL